MSSPSLCKKHKYCGQSQVPRPPSAGRVLTVSRGAAVGYSVTLSSVFPLLPPSVRQSRLPRIFTRPLSLMLSVVVMMHPLHSSSSSSSCSSSLSYLLYLFAQPEQKCPKEDCRASAKADYCSGDERGRATPAPSSESDSQAFAI